MNRCCPDGKRAQANYQLAGGRPVRGDAFGNARRSSEFQVQESLKKIGQPVDRSDWSATTAVNAYYSQLTNDIVLPAGVFQPPFYDPKMDDAVNFGGIGALVGHELTHAFDAEGSQLDGQGNLRNWWTTKDREEFERLEQCFVDEYNDLAKSDHLLPHGRVSLNENTADNGGLRIALMALLELEGSTSQKAIDGFTPQQRFFLTYAQTKCENERPDSARLTSAHSPGKLRVNGVVSNMPEFQQAFACKENAPMVHKPACQVW